MAAKLDASSLGGGHADAYPDNNEINVTPFVDIMLVLLIIFMVAAPPPTVDIKVDLPPPNSVNDPNQQQDKPTFVSLEDNNGQLLYYVSGQEVPEDRLPTVLLDVARLNNPSMRGNDTKLFFEGKIFVDADQDTLYINVVNLMNVIDETGFKKVSLVAEEAQF